MDRKFTPSFADFAQTHPALGILRLTALLAEAEAEPDETTLDDMIAQVEAGVLADAAPSLMWPELTRGLMARSPARTIRILRGCGALSQLLPEVEALFGVPQITDEPSPVDIGEHLLKALSEAARCNAPLAVRFSLLLMNIGKADSPAEHLPSHYRHIDRGLPRIEAICQRLGTPAECRELALLALMECERVHRVSKVRAGPVASMLERAGAFEAPELFGLLMLVCACDYRAYGDRSGQPYPKGVLLDLALRACAEIEESGCSRDQRALEAVRSARAMAISRAFRSQRWSDGET